MSKAQPAGLKPNAINRRRGRAPLNLLVLAVAATALAGNSSADSANQATRDDPAVMARAKFCGSHRYSNADNPVQGDHFADGDGIEARFLYPLGIAIDARGILYVADTGNRVVRRIAPNGTVTTLAGTPGRQGCSDGAGLQASFYEVRSIAVDNDGTVLVPDAGTNKIRKITRAGQVSTLVVRGEAPPAGTSTATTAATATATAAEGSPMGIEYNTPMGIAVDGSSDIYVTLANAVLKILPNGTERVLAGSPMGHPWGTNAWNDQTANRDGNGTAARLNSAYGIAVDSQGTAYVTDNNMGVIKSIAQNGEVKTFAGVVYDHAFPQNSSQDGNAGEARFFVPEGVAVDRSGTVYVADRRNSTIRKITPAGVVSTLAGAPREVGSQDGTGSAARFVSPSALTVDADGNLYVADSSDNTIRKVTPAGVVTTIAGRSAYRERISGSPGAPAAQTPVPDLSVVSQLFSALLPSPLRPAPPQLAMALGGLASQDYVISPRQVAAALNLPLSEFKWLSDGSGGWIKFDGAFDGTAISSAVLGYRRRMASDGTVSGGQMQAPWRAAYVSLVVNMADRSCLSADDVAAKTQITGTAVRTSRDLANRAGPAVKGGVEFALSKNNPVRKVLTLDGKCARGIWIHKWDFNGQDLPLEPPDTASAGAGTDRRRDADLSATGRATEFGPLP
jgi:sugar lactone lactonase YvrE